MRSLQAVAKRGLRTVAALIVVFVAIVILVTIANRINVAYPIVLVLGGMAIGYLPGVPTFPLPPDLVLLVFLPPLLYWESVTAPTSEFRAGAFWIFQMAFGLVIVTTLSRRRRRARRHSWNGLGRGFRARGHRVVDR